MIKTTDNQNEIFDIVNEEDRVIGQTTRGEAHGNPKLMHRSIGVVIFNSKGEIFLQQRSATKDTDPLKWTISCSGHVESQTLDTEFSGRNLLADKNFLDPQLATGTVDHKTDKYSAGGTDHNFIEPSSKCDLRKFYHASYCYKNTAYRELEEELGLNMKLHGLTPVVSSNSSASEIRRSITLRLSFDKLRIRSGYPQYRIHPRVYTRGFLRRRINYKNAAKANSIKIKPVCKFIYRGENETEIMMLFQVFSDGPFRINKEEIKQGKFFTRKMLNRLIKSGEIQLSKAGKLVLEKINWL